MRGVTRIARWTVHYAKQAGLPWLDFGDHRLVAILRYHSVSDGRDANHRYVNQAIAVSPATFERHIAFLAAHYRCVRMDDVVEALDRGRPLPRNAVVVTFDDGYWDNYRYAYPILRRYGVPAMFYVAAGCVDDETPLWMSELRSIIHRATARWLDDPTTPATYDLDVPGAREFVIGRLKQRLAWMQRQDRDEVLDELRARCAPAGPVPRVMLRWTEIDEMRAGGMDVGAHTVSHPRLTALPADEAAAEIRESKTLLEGRLRAPVRHFSYPNPGKGVHVDAGVRRLVAAARFTTAVTSLPGYVQDGAECLELRRLVVGAGPSDVAWDVERPALGQALWTLVAGAEERTPPVPAWGEAHAGAAVRIRRLRAAHTAALAHVGTAVGRAVDVIEGDAFALSEGRATFAGGESQ